MKRAPQAVVLFLLAWAGSTLAQEPVFMDAATHPGAGQYYGRLLWFHEFRDDGAGRDFRTNTGTIKLAYGIKPWIAILGDIEGQSRHGGSRMRSTAGISRGALRLKLRLFRFDLGPLDTWRGSLTAGTDFPGSNPRLGDRHLSPRLGVVSTAILGRHGLNGQLEWTAKVNQPDVFAVNASHLYRLAPRTYSPQTRGAWYTMLESLSAFTDHGHSRTDLAGGILYEAQRWAWETSVRVPLAQDWPFDSTYVVQTGLRYLF